MQCLIINANVSRHFKTLKEPKIVKMHDVLFINEYKIVNTNYNGVVKEEYFIGGFGQIKAASFPVLCVLTLPYATDGEKGLPLPGVDGLLRGLYPDTQLGENFGLVLGDRAGLKLSTFCPCSGDDWEATGVSFFSGFWGGVA